MSSADRPATGVDQRIDSAVPQASAGFTYVQARDTDEAVQIKGRSGQSSRFWAGGTDLMLEWARRQRRFEVCIDISRIDDLRQIEVGDESVVIGACVTLDELDRAGSRCEELELLGAVARVMCTRQTRTLATVGGNLANASPAADLAAPLIALDASARVLSAERPRTLPVAELFLGPKRSALRDDEILHSISMPRRPRRGSAFGRIGRTQVDIALVSSACSIEVDEYGRIASARAGLSSVAPTPIAVDLGPVLKGWSIDELDLGALEAAGRLTVEAAAPIDDLRSSAAYRRRMCGVLTRRALGEAALRLSSAGRGA